MPNSSAQIQLILRNKDGYGFFSDTFRILFLKLLAEKASISFLVDDSDWLFGCKQGWSLFFTSLVGQTGLHSATIPMLSEELYDNQCIFQVAEYRRAMKELYEYQPWLLERVQTTMQQLGLAQDDFAAIFIRRGDKCIRESVVIPTKAYVKEVLEKWPACRTIFVQTDDYRAVEEVRSLVSEGVRVVTTCPENKLGAFVFDFHPENGTTVPCQRNVDYMASFGELPAQRVIAEFSAEEMKEHVAEMLVGLEICKRGCGVSLDYLSNTSRFLVFSHPKGAEGVWTVEKHIQFGEEQPIRCPRFFPFTH
jgi:hypothetical protein